MKLEQAKEVTKLRQEVEQGAKELASKYERKMKVCLCPQLPSLVPSRPPSGAACSHMLLVFAWFLLTVFLADFAYICSL